MEAVSLTMVIGGYGYNFQFAPQPWQAIAEDKYRQFLATYSIAEIESIWNSVFGMCNLFQCTAVEFSKNQNF